MPAAGWTAVETSDADEAAWRFARAYPSLRVSAERDGGPFEFHYRSVATERFSVSRMRCSGRVRASGPLPEAVAIGRRTAGSVAIGRGARTIDTALPYLRPVAPADFELTDGDVMLVTLEPASLTEYLERSGERGVLVNRLATAPHLTAWGLVMDHAGSYLDDPAALSDSAQHELHDLLCWGLLHAFDDPWAETSRAGASSNALKRALRYLDEHADEAVTMPEVAEAARISVRSLGMLFRRELDTTPHRWLRDRRLDRARIDLMAGTGTVAQSAARHGLLHPGRFAVEYRARFGEHPGETLRGNAGRR